MATPGAADVADDYFVFVHDIEDAVLKSADQLGADRAFEYYGCRLGMSCDPCDRAFDRIGNFRRGRRIVALNVGANLADFGDSWCSGPSLAPEAIKEVADFGIRCKSSLRHIVGTSRERFPITLGHAGQAREFPFDHLQ
jgi:hypothetical protein